MEHLPVPPGTTYIDVPLKCAGNYDSGPFPFDMYPECHGWIETELLGLPGFGERSDDEVQDFFQTWLFFGTLTEVFKAAGVKFSSAEFIREKGKFVTTEQLPRLIQEWKDREASAGDVHGRTKSRKKAALLGSKEERGRKITKILDEIQKYVSIYCYDEGKNGENFRQNGSWPIAPEISLSLIALGWSLNTAATEIYDLETHNEMGRWGYSETLVERLRKAGWCISEITQLVRDHHVDGLFYFGSLTSPRKDQRHEKCTEKMCDPKGVDESKYEQIHQHPKDEKCQDISVAEEVSGIVGDGPDGGIPLVSFKNSKLEVCRYKTGMRYLAISHVWSDGRGNPNGNSLPECQLRYLQDLMDKLYTTKPDIPQGRRLFGPQRAPEVFDTSQEEVMFWMDTFCVPVDDDSLKKKAIKQMRDIYGRAHRVLVIDSWIQELDLSARVIDKAARLYLSNWQHRLWTLQEALLAKNLYFQLKDGPQMMSEMWEENEEYQRVGTGIYSSIVGLTLSLVPTFGYSLEYREDDLSIEPPSGLFGPMLVGIMRRLTSHKSDETICFATLLGLGSREMDMIYEAKGEARMEVFLSIIGKFQPGFIFNDLPRLEKKGFRWAPRTFLGISEQILPDNGGDSSVEDEEDEWESDSEEEEDSDDGSDPDDTKASRLVEDDFAGVNVQDIDVQDGTLLEGGGLVVTFPGIKLGRVGTHVGSSFTVISRKHRDLWGCRITLKPEENKSAPWDADASYAVVLSTPMAFGPNACEAMLGVLEDPTNTATQPVKLTFVMKVRVESVGDRILRDLNRKWGDSIQYHAGSTSTPGAIDNNCPILGHWMKTDTRWCIF